MEQLAKMDKRWSFANNRLHAAEHKDVVYLICILAITVIAFFPTFLNDFQMQWDDQWQVKNSFTTGEYNLWNSLFSENQGYMGQFSPLNQFIYTVLYNIGGYNHILYSILTILSIISSTQYFILSSICISSIFFKSYLIFFICI